MDGLSPGGIAWRSPNGVLSAEAELVWSSQSEVYYRTYHQPEVPGELEKGTLPLLVSAGTTIGLIDTKLFANLKGIGEIHTDDRSGFTVRAIPGLEFRPWKWFAPRGAYEYALVDIDGTSLAGSGYMAGFSFVLGDFDLNANFVQRYRPNRMLPGTGHDTQSILIGATRNGLGARK